MKHNIYKRYPMGNKRFTWKQKDFILSSFNCVGDDMDKAIRNCIEAGFNMVELGWAPHDKAWEAVELCEKYGLDIIFQDFTIMGGMMGKFFDREIDPNAPKMLAEAFKDKKHMIGYYVWDEPYFPEHMKEARRQSDMLHEVDPDALLFSVALPSYNFDYMWENGLYPEYLENYVKTMDPPVFSMDHYPVGDCPREDPRYFYSDEKQLDDTYMWCDLGMVRKLAKKYDLPMWFYYQGCEVYPTTKHFEFPMVRAMMYAAALYGAKGLQHYTAQLSVLEKTGEKGRFFNDQKQIHSEFKNLGNTLMALESRLVYHSKELLPGCKYLDGIVDDISDSKIFTGELPKRTSIGELDDAYGNTYAMILNRDFESDLDTVLKLSGDFRIYEVSREDGKQRVIYDCVSELPIKLVPGDAVLYRIQPASEEAFTAEYQLEEK